MRLCFVDTWFLIASVDPFDGHHRQAIHLERLTADAVLVTHEGVLAEFLTYFGAFGSGQRGSAARRVQSLRTHPQYEVATFTPLFPDAVELYSRRSDKEYSLVDCMSMVLMRARGLTHVLTNDHHFRQEGFTVVNE
jgi:predicted nucleic acid-binding protein